MRYPTPADTAASTGEALAREKVTKISSNFLLPLSDQAHVLRNAENRRQRRRLSRGHRRGKLILWCNKHLGTIYLYIWDFRKGQNMVQRMSLGLYPSTPQPFRESFVKMWNCWISKCWGVALIVFSSRLSPLLLSLQLRQFAFLGHFQLGPSVFCIVFSRPSMPQGSQAAWPFVMPLGIREVYQIQWLSFIQQRLQVKAAKEQKAKKRKHKRTWECASKTWSQVSFCSVTCHFCIFCIIFDPNITFETSPYCKIHTVEWFLSLECKQPLQEPQGLRYRGNLLPTHCPTSCDPVSFEKTIRQSNIFTADKDTRVLESRLESFPPKNCCTTTCILLVLIQDSILFR